MGTITVEEVVQILDEGGIRSEPAFPAQPITRITEPVAAVSLGEVNQESGLLTMLVEILGPKEKGGYVCQSKAAAACQILAEAGAVCYQENCVFLNKSNLFRVQIRAVFSVNELFKLTIDQRQLNYVCGFSSVQKKTEDGDNLQDMPWEFTVEELIPWQVQDTWIQEEPFVLQLHCAGNVERYGQCRWKQRKRIAEKRGIRQIRTGIAMNRSDTKE